LRKPSPNEAAALQREIARFDRENVSSTELLALLSEAGQAFEEFVPRVAETTAGGLQLEVEASDPIRLNSESALGRAKSSKPQARPHSKGGGQSAPVLGLASPFDRLRDWGAAC
jgi:hypothetical protein